MKNLILKTSLLFSLFFILFSCSDDDEADMALPTVTSNTNSSNIELTYTTAKINGNVTSSGGSNVTARGVCWSTSPNPTIADNKTMETSNTFTSEITNLIANTTYYFRVYATNGSGTSYGAGQTHSTLALDNTTWDFHLIYDSNTSVHGDVIFNADGTAVYDEPASPGAYTSYGTWSLSGNNLTYQLDSIATHNYYIFTGTLSGNSMSGTFDISTGTKNWSATKY